MFTFKLLFAFGLLAVVSHAQYASSSVSCVNGVCTYQNSGQPMNGGFFPANTGFGGGQQPLFQNLQPMGNIGQIFPSYQQQQPQFQFQQQRGNFGGNFGNNNDQPPPGNSYTCAQQAGWGKCGESWMQGYCCQTCGGC